VGNSKGVDRLCQQALATGTTGLDVGLQRRKRTGPDGPVCFHVWIEFLSIVQHIQQALEIGGGSTGAGVHPVVKEVGGQVSIEHLDGGEAQLVPVGGVDFDCLRLGVVTHVAGVAELTRSGLSHPPASWAAAILRTVSELVTALALDHLVNYLQTDAYDVPPSSGMPNLRLIKRSIMKSPRPPMWPVMPVATAVIYQLMCISVQM